MNKEINLRKEDICNFIIKEERILNTSIIFKKFHKYKINIL